MRVLKKLGVKDVKKDPTLAPGSGRHTSRLSNGNQFEGVIRVHPESSISVLFHELMHFFHIRSVVRKDGRAGFQRLQNDPREKEQAAFELTYLLFGRWMSPREIQAHADNLSRQYGGDPSTVYRPN
ncbi:MAG: hypothetical protein NXI04_29785 [Planctomycetaceae bacterium]|nr:hypothetical protein [Planctomycetaceae bacterium]